MYSDICSAAAANERVLPPCDVKPDAAEQTHSVLYII